MKKRNNQFKVGDLVFYVKKGIDFDIYQEMFQNVKIRMPALIIKQYTHFKDNEYNGFKILLENNVRIDVYFTDLEKIK